MSILNPLGLLFALLAVPIILLYLLRLQRREQTVSSTLLWRQVILDREANTLWQRLRRNLLLLLQLLTLAVLVFALVRPYLNLPSTLSGRLVILLDGSASMQATDVAPSRFEAARAEIRKLIDQIGPSNDMTIILVDGSPHALVSATSSKSELNAALDTASASLQTANWSAGVALASAAGGGGADGQATTIVYSDGVNANDLQALTGNVRYIPIGKSGDNIAISTLSLRKTPRGLAAFVRVNNTGSVDDRVLVSIRSDNLLLDARMLNIPAGQSASWTIDGIDPQVSSVRAAIDQAGHNDLPIDDVAYVVNEKTAQRRALLLTPGNRFLEQALAVLPNLHVTRAISAPVQADARPYDLYVLDGLTMTLPAHASVLFIGAQSVFTTSGTFSSTAFMRSEQHPVLNSVDWRNVNALDIYRINAPAWLKPIVLSDNGPMLYAGEMLKQTDPFWRVVDIPFSLQLSDLPLQVAFPILIANSVEWLAPPQGLNIPAGVKPGDVVALPAGAIVQRPDGSRVAVGQRGFAQTDALGVYSVLYKDVAGMFTVNFSNPAESKIAPNPDLHIGGQTPADRLKPQYSQREFWSWLAAAALVLLVVEWWVYQRGVPLLRRK